MKRREGHLNEEPAEALRRSFTLAPDDLVVLEQVREAHRLILALMITWTRTERVLLSNLEEIPQEVISFVSAQLGMKSEVIGKYQISPVTRARYNLIVRNHLHLRSFGVEDGEHLRVFLIEKAGHTGNTAALLDAAEEWLFREELLRPSGETTLERLVFRVRNQSEENMFAFISGQLDQNYCRSLDSLCETDTGDSRLSALASAPRAASAHSILAECVRLREIRAHLPREINWGSATLNRRRQWTNIVRRHYAQALRRYPEPKRYTLLLSFLSIREEEITDAIIEMMDFLIGRVFARSESDLAEVKLKKVQTYSVSMSFFRTVAEVLLNPNIPMESVRDEVFRRISRDRVSELYEQAIALDTSELKAYLAILCSRFPRVREYIPIVLDTLQFASSRPQNELLEAIEILRKMGAERLRKVPEEAPLGFIPKRWLKAVQGADGVDRRAWELCLLSEVRAALRAGDITVEGSRRYMPWDTELYPPDAWQSRRASWFEESDLQEDGIAYVSEAKEQLHLLAREVTCRLSENNAVRIERGKIVLSPLESSEPSVELEKIRARLTAVLPMVSLPELLMEVDHWTGFSSELTHLTSRRASTSEHIAPLRPAIFAVLIAEATNIGLSTMAAASGIPHGQLVRTHDWYFREETLRPAITRLIRYHHDLPFTKSFGSGTTSSSDGVRFGVSASALNARHLPRYFGTRRGVTVYSHVSDQGSLYWMDVINCNVRDATHVLDGLVYQDVLPIREHYTDTHGYTDLIFGLFELLGYTFAPRLRDLPHQIIYRPYRNKDYGTLNPILRQVVQDKLIMRHWDDLNRLAASLKDGRVMPSLIVSKLQAMKRQNHLQRAIQEMGRISKTRHILNYIDDEQFRRRILIGLNKGERVNQMARIIFFGRQGRFGDRGYEEQLNRASALSVVINAIIVWNTRYLEIATQDMTRRGRPIPSDAWPNVTPLLWKHINLVGKYSFDEPNIHGELRPLTEESEYEAIEPYQYPDGGAV